jgi:glycosyltransferase involved in cell wall biosynthesis
MRILYECDLAGSKYHGMAYRIFQFSSEFVKHGHNVMVVTASFSHVRKINPKVSKQLTNEEIEGVQYKWIKTPKYKGNGIGRILHIFIYNLKLWFYANKLAKEFKPDVVISSGVTPFDFIGCYRIAKKANASILYEVGDLWPLTPVELGGFSPKHPIIRIMQSAENYAYKNTDAVISILPCAEEYMKKHGLNSNKFNYIPNGIIIDEWENQKELPEEHDALIKKLKNKNKFLIGYTGAHGIANSLGTVIEAVSLLKVDDIVLLLVGNGTEKEKLKKYVRDNKIGNVYFLPAIQKTEIPAFLSMMDILYIGLQSQPLFRFGISPNKMFDYMMAGKPIIQAIDAGNNLVENANCGLFAEPENPIAISDALIKIKNMSIEQRANLGNNGRKYVIDNHNYNLLTEKYMLIITNAFKKKMT